MKSLFSTIPIIIASMERTFSSHKLILPLRDKYPDVYYKAVKKYEGSKNPVRIVHSLIGKHLRSDESSIEFVKFIYDINLSGKNTRNALWKKKDRIA